MARDLFEEFGVAAPSQGGSVAAGGGRDLFAEFGIKPTKPAPQSFADAAKEYGLGNESTLGNIAAGAGKAVVDTGRGVRQLLSKIGIGDSAAIQQEIDDAAKRDAPLMDTGGGITGNIAGNAASMLVPGAMIGKAGQAMAAMPRLAGLGSAMATAGGALTAPASIGAAATAGAGMGALQPVTSDQGDMARLANMAFGAGGGAGGQYLGGKAADWMANSGAKKLAELLASKSGNAVKDATLAASKDAGYQLPPSMQQGGMMARLAEGLSGKYKTQELATLRNQGITDNLARKGLGLADDAQLTSETTQALRKQAYQTGYEPVANSGRVTTDKAYQDALDAIASKHQGAASDFPGAASSSVTDFINGTGTKAIPARSAWVDNLGNVLEDSAIPKEPKVRNLLEEIKAAGGLHVGEQGDIGIEKLNKAVPGLLNKKGLDGDALVDWMTGNRWISVADAKFADDNLTGGAHELARDMIRSSVNKEPIIHPRDQSAWNDYIGATKDLEDAGVKRITIPGQSGDGGLRVASFDAGNALKMSQILRDEASAAYRTGDNALGKAKREASKAIEDQIERHLRKDGASAEAGDLLKNFRDARQLMAKSHTVEDAIKEGGGHVDALKLAAMLQRGKPLSGELETIGKFGNNFRPVAGVPKSDSANPFTVLDFAGGAVGGAISPLAALMPLGRVAARHAVLSKSAQAAMGPDYEMSKLAKLLADAKTQGVVRRGAMPLSIGGAELYGSQ